ncbi:PREDICTED: F-box/LRR-repeat protein 3-like [Fragaria vesca subsp. vesca]|uniref:F-box/LRR-repeat protein 3-like n=1 Tax=Fragaria vesca subsp. vesca TaxID=101020 RepID=UPI0002C2FFF6|nr:PREDICTED: F-box/LRR-repeat protein 3-like [Fragaria vesca subsp. vesca]
MAVHTKKISGKTCVLSDDLLGLILNYVTNKDDRKSFSEVWKQWFRVEGLNRSSLCVDKPDIPLPALTRFPNLVHFETWKHTTDTDLEFIAQICPQIEVIKVTNYGSHFLGRKGLWALGNGCPKLSKVSLFGNKIGNSAVFALVNSAQILTSLAFTCNSFISDPVLRAIGSQCCITTLEFTSSCNITDLGLGFLANGCVSKTLKRLVLDEMVDRISDGGITDIGGVAISGIQTLRELRLFLEGISDATIVALAENCPKLEILDIKDCHEVRRDGILAFSSHQCLKSLVLLGLWDFDLFDVESIALGCPSLESVVVDSSLRVDPAWSSELMHEHTKKSHQVLDMRISILPEAGSVLVFLSATGSFLCNCFPKDSYQNLDSLAIQ